MTDKEKPIVQLATKRSEMEDNKRKTQEEMLELNKEALLSHLDMLTEKVENGDITHMVVAAEDQNGLHFSLSGESENPFQMYYNLKKAIPVAYENHAFVYEYEDE